MNLDLPKRYQLSEDSVLGEGGMGRVLKAHDVVLDVPVALKVVRPDLASDPRFKRLFELEVRISARFTHPNIVPLHDYGVTELGTPFLGLAFAQQGSFARFRAERVDWPEIRRLTGELLGALAHLHARGVLHRDLKPENVLLHDGDDGSWHVWLADLGLAKAGRDLARAKGRAEGTPGFMAPEQRLGLPREYGPWTDLYALGVMLWEVTTGHRPFADHQTALDGALPEYTPRLAVPPELGTVLANLLCPEPMSRYDQASDLARELDALGEPVYTGDSITATPGTVAPSAASLSSDIELVEGAVRDTSTLFQIRAGDIRPDGTDPNVPGWNRPLPDTMPMQPPVEHTAQKAAASLALFTLRDPPLVGRDSERQALWDHARAVAEERKPRVVLLVGEAGAGKARVVESIRLALEEGGWAESVALSWQRQEGADDGYPGAARALLRPWNESRASLTARLRRRLARERGRYDATIRSEADTLARWCGLLEDGEDPVAQGLGLREVYRHLEARTWRGLACLVLSDVQWSRDEGDGLAIPEALLASTEAGVSDKPLLVLATLRREALHEDPALAERVRALEEAGAHRLDLSRLDRDQTLRLLQESLRLAPGLANRVVRLCEGNPLFARQLLLEWASRGWLVDTGDLTFDLAEGVGVEAAIPRDAEDLFAERLERLSEASGSARRFRDAVHMAALSGKQLPRDLVLGLCGEGLEPFVRGCGLWQERDEWLTFDSTLLHQAMLQDAEGRPDVSYLHRRLGKAWARHGEQSGTDVAAAAGLHASLGKDWTLAAEQLLLAAERAWLRGQIHDLDEASERAFAVVREHQQLRGHWGRAALFRGRALQLMGEAARAGEAFEEAARTLAEAGDASGEADARSGLGWSWLRQGQLDRADQAYGAAMARAREAGASRAEAEAIAGKAWVEQQRRNFEGADILFTRAVNLLIRLEEERALGEATLGQAFVARRTGDFDTAVELYEEAGEAFEAGDDPLGKLQADLGLALTLRQQQRLDACEEALKDTMKACEELGVMPVLMECRLAQADLLRDRSEPDKARRIYEEHLGWAERNGAFQTAIQAQLGLLTLDIDAGALLAAHQRAKAVVTQLERVPGHWLWATYRLVVATLLALRGEPDQAWEWLWSASELGLKDTVDTDVVHCLERIRAEAGRRGEGWERVDRLAGQLLVPQLTHLGQTDRARSIRQSLHPRT